MKVPSLPSKILALLLVAAGVCRAQSQSELPQGALRIATGPGNGVYAQLARDIQRVCGQTVPIVPVASKGGLENLMLLSSSQADIGFAQVDLLQQMSKGGDENMQELQGLISMHANLLHVITRASGSRLGESKWNPLAGETRILRKFSDLNAKGVRVVLVGSAILMGQTLERQLGYGMTFLQADTDEQAIDMLRANQADAIFTTGGWPYPAIAKQRASSGLLLADYDLQASAPYAVAKRNYPNLDAFNVNFLASTNLLLTRPFRPTGERGRQVLALRKCLLQNLDEFKEGPYNSVWKEVKNPADVLGAPAFAGAGNAEVTTVADRKSRLGLVQTKQ